MQEWCRAQAILMLKAEEQLGLLDDWITDMIMQESDVVILFEDDDLHFTLWGPGENDYRTVWFNEWLVLDEDGTVRAVEHEEFVTLTPGEPI